MKRRLAIVIGIVTIMLISIGLAGCGSTQTQANPETTGTTVQATTQEATQTAQATTQDTKKTDVKVGFIYTGPIGDGGWTYAHDQGRLYLEKTLGVKTIYKESVSDQNADSVQVMKDMIDQGCSVIIGTSFGYMDYMEKVAKDYPNVKFLHCSGYKTGDNYGNYFGRIEQPRYLSGIAAAMKTKSNKIGYVAAFEIPEVIRGINSFTLGVRSVNPNATVEVVWTHTWYDPAKEKDAAKALLEKGCDVIAQHQDTTGPQLAAQEKGAFAIGYNTDSKNAAPKAYITAPVWNWGPYYVSQVKAIMDGTWKAGSYWGDMKDGIVDLAPLTGNAAPGTQEKIDEVKKKMLDRSFDLWAGPIKDQSGKVKVAQGQTVDDKGQLSMDWFVEGVIGNIAKQ